MDTSTFASRLAVVVDLLGGHRRGRAELSRRSGVSVSSIGDYIRGAHKPKADVVVRLAKAGEVSLDWLLDGAGPMMAGADQPPVQVVREPQAPYDLATRLREVNELLKRLQAEVGVELATPFLMALQEMLAEGQITEKGARRLMEEFRAEAPPR